MNRIVATIWFFLAALSWMLGYEGLTIYWFGMGLMDAYHSKP